VTTSGSAVTTISGTSYIVVPSSSAVTITVNNAVVTNKGNVSTPGLPTKSVVPDSGGVSLRAWGSAVVVGVLVLGLNLALV
jgi:hypothetical protein